MSFEALDSLLRAEPLFALFVVIAGGLAVGAVRVLGVRLGTSCVLFTGLVAGHLGYALPAACGPLGLVLFVYCVGISAGVRFFGAMVREGKQLVRLAVLVVLAGAAVAALGAWALSIPAELAAGIFAGSLTSTPALAAATESLSPSAQRGLTIGYGISYPVGVVGVVLFVQLLPRLLRIDLDALAKQQAAHETDEDRVETVLIEVENPNLIGKRISEAGISQLHACQFSRVLRNDRLEPLRFDDAFERGQVLLLVGRSQALEIAVDHIGHRVQRRVLTDVENERRQILLTSPRFAGRSLRELVLLRDFGVVVTRITRFGLEFVPRWDSVLERNDQLTVTGLAADLERFAVAVGHRDSAVGITDLLSLTVGISLGILVGAVPLGLPGGEPMTLGLAGGPLLVALVLGHFGRVGGVVGHIPRPTRLLLQDLGLTLFLADAGCRGGEALVETVVQHGPSLLLLSLLCASLPLLAGWVFARRMLGIDPLRALGGICGAATSTPALGALTARCDVRTVVVSYVAAYPAALLVMTVVARLLVDLLAGAGAAG